MASLIPITQIVMLAFIIFAIFLHLQKGLSSEFFAIQQGRKKRKIYDFSAYEEKNKNEGAGRKSVYQLDFPQQAKDVLVKANPDYQFKSVCQNQFNHQEVKSSTQKTHAIFAQKYSFQSQQNQSQESNQQISESQELQQNPLRVQRELSGAFNQSENILLKELNQNQSIFAPLKVSSYQNLIQNGIIQQSDNLSKLSSSNHLKETTESQQNKSKVQCELDSNTFLQYNACQNQEFNFNKAKDSRISSIHIGNQNKRQREILNKSEGKQRSSRNKEKALEKMKEIQNFTAKTQKDLSIITAYPLKEQPQKQQEQDENTFQTSSQNCSSKRKQLKDCNSKLENQKQQIAQQINQQNQKQNLSKNEDKLCAQSTLRKDSMETMEVKEILNQKASIENKKDMDKNNQNTNSSDLSSTQDRNSNQSSPISSEDKFSNEQDSKDLDQQLQQDQSSIKIDQKQINLEENIQQQQIQQNVVEIPSCNQLNGNTFEQFQSISQPVQEKVYTNIELQSLSTAPSFNSNTDTLFITQDSIPQMYQKQANLCYNTLETTMPMNLQSNIMLQETNNPISQQIMNGFQGNQNLSPLGIENIYGMQQGNYQENQQSQYQNLNIVSNNGNMIEPVISQQLITLQCQNMAQVQGVQQQQVASNDVMFLQNPFQNSLQQTSQSNIVESAPLFATFSNIINSYNNQQNIQSVSQPSNITQPQQDISQNITQQVQNPLFSKTGSSNKALFQLKIANPLFQKVQNF